MKAIVSILLLGIQIILHFIKLPFRRKGHDEERFYANYRPDRLLPLPNDPQLRVRLAAFERCIGCGLCNTLCTTLRIAPRHQFGGPATLAMSARSFPDFPYFAAHTVNDASCGSCHACEGLCPVSLPLRELANHVREHAGRLLLI